MQIETQCVHSGRYRDVSTRGTNTPIFTSSSFEYLDREEPIYPRYFNTPNQDSVVRKLCALEQAEEGILFSSGMADFPIGPSASKARPRESPRAGLERTAAA